MNAASDPQSYGEGYSSGAVMALEAQRRMIEWTIEEIKKRESLAAELNVLEVLDILLHGTAETAAKIVLLSEKS